MIHPQPGSLHFDTAICRASLTVCAARGDQWLPVPLRIEGDNFTGQLDGVTVRLKTSGALPGQLDYELSFEATEPTRLQLRLDLPGIGAPFHLIPGNIFGDNNLEFAEPGHFPNLTLEHAGNVSCAPYWEFRADRAALPLSLVCFDGGVAAVSIDPYSDGTLESDNRDGFLRNGVYAEIARGDRPDSCGVTLGYCNTPRTFLNKDEWQDATMHNAAAARAHGSVFIAAATDRTAAHDVVRQVYKQYRATPATPLNRCEAMTALTDAFLNINWQPARENFSNMRCIDEAKQTLTAWRTLAEVGWTGGGVIGYPLMLAGHLLDDNIALERGRNMLDWVARAYNPESGLLWEVCGKHEGKQVDWWWSGYIVKGLHNAYVNGSGLYYLLKSFDFCRTKLHEEILAWRETGLKALDTIVGLQEPNGNFGFTYRVDRPQVVDRHGFAGVWFAAALALAYRISDDRRYLDAAIRGIEFYHGFVRDLNCWGTPMDTWKSVDQEGNLGFMRAARLLHEITGDARFLEMLEGSAHYEYLWRYGFAARAEYPPLKGSHWGSCGGSITSVSNPHIHPMGIFISRDLQYLAEQTGDAYHQARYEDGINFGLNIVSLYPEVSGYGAAGVLTERFCPSDGLTIETFPDGSPASLWFSYNGWAAAAVLEGLAETAAP